MMDFKTPDRSRYYDPRPTHRDPSRAAPERIEPEPAAPPPAEAAPRKRRARKSRGLPFSWKKLLGGLILIALIVWLAHGYIATRNQLEQAKNTPSSAGSTQTDQLIGKVGQLVDLPQGETPTIATVNDASKLKNQQFFASAKDGDKVLIYSKAGKAVLYRPSTNRIIDYSTVNLGGSPTQ
jgi:hypothetical protein